MDPIKVLERRIDGLTQRQAAAELGISLGYLNDLIHGRREAGPMVLRALGLERRVTYHRVRDAAQ